MIHCSEVLANSHEMTTMVELVHVESLLVVSIWLITIKEAPE